MSTNLVIGYPQVGFDGTILTSTTASAGYEANRTTLGSRQDRFQTSANVTTSVIDFDYGSTIAPDFFYIGRANLLYLSDSSDPVVSLIGASDSAFTTPTNYNVTLDISRLVGSSDEDMIEFPLSTAAFQYWRVKAATTASFQHSYSKIAFGNVLDFGVDPLHPRTIERKFNNSKLSRRTNFGFEFNWAGITNALRSQFDDSIGAYKDVMTLYLMTRYYHEVLCDARVVPCRILSYRWTPQEIGLNNLTISFEEVI